MINALNDQSRHACLLAHEPKARLLLKCCEHVGAVAACRLVRVGSIRILARKKTIARPFDLNVEHSRKSGAVDHPLHQHGFLEKSGDVADGNALTCQTLTHATTDGMAVRTGRILQ